MSLTNKFERDTLDALFGATGITGATHYVGLVLTGGSITEAGVVTSEVSGAGTAYVRKEITNNVTTWPAAATDGSNVSTQKNGIDIEFAEATGDWGEIALFFIATHESDTGDAIIGYGDITVPRNILDGDIARFKEDELVITLD